MFFFRLWLFVYDCIMIGKLSAADPEAANRVVLLKKAFLEVSQNSQESTCARVSF